MSAAATAVRVPVGAVSVDGDLTLPGAASGVVVFAHGSGSSRHSPRNRNVAEVLQQARLATLLLDLLTPEEDATDERTACAVGRTFSAAGNDWLNAQHRANVDRPDKSAPAARERPGLANGERSSDAASA